MTPTHSLRRLLALTSILLCVPCCDSAAAAGYKAKAIGDVGPGDCFLSDLNASGQAVGGCHAAENFNLLAYATDAKGKNIHEIAGLAGDWNWTMGLNDSGVLVGYGTLVGHEIKHAWVQQPDGKLLDLGTLGDADANSYALNINNSGLIVGKSQFNWVSAYRGFVIYPGTTKMVDIGSLGGTYISPHVVNNNGVIGGYGYPSSNDQSRAFYAKPPYTTLVMLNTLGGSWSSLLGMNASGVFVGYSSLAGDSTYRAFVGKVGSKKVTELSTPAGDSFAYGINKLGVIVGDYTRASDGKTAPFSCTSDCSDFLDLNTVTTGLPAGVELRGANAVNDKGMIGARGSDNRIYLLLPQ